MFPLGNLGTLHDNPRTPVRSRPATQDTIPPIAPMDLLDDFDEHDVTVPSNPPPILAPFAMYPPPPIFAPFATYPQPPPPIYPIASASGSVRETLTSIVHPQAEILSLPPTIENNQAALLQAFQGRALSSRVNVATMKWELQCPDCRAWVSTGLRSERTLGETDGHFSGLVTHRKGKKCATEWKSSWAFTGGDPSLTGPDEVLIPQLPPRTSSAPPDPLSPVKRTKAAWYSANAHDFDAAYSAYLDNGPRPGSAPPDIPDGPPCPGISVHWPDSLDIYDTFPWSRLGPTAGPDQLPFCIGIQDQGSRFIAHSHRCVKSVNNASVPCLECQSIAPRVEGVISAAQIDKVPHKLISFSPRQLRERLRDRIQTMNQWKLKALNLGRSVAAAAQKAVDFKRFTMALAEMDAAKVGTLVQTALRHGASISAIVTQIEQAIKGTYNPRFVSERALDISTLIYRIGGRALLYSMNHALGLPSLRTLQHHLSFIRIMPTVGDITLHTIEHNLQEVLIKPLMSLAKVIHHHGASILIDEIALEEAACHFRHVNMVGGLCWKHSRLFDLVLRTYHSAVELAKHLAKGDLHLGKEMTVASVSFFGAGDSRTYPILAAPTCKQEDAGDMAHIFEMLVSAYNKVAAAITGPLWSVATDGDSTRRKAGYYLFVKNRLSPSSPIYSTLVQLPGLNLFTGEGDVTLDFDWKHVYKRISTLMRSVSGLVLGPGRIISPSFLSKYLILLDGQDSDSVNKLLYPSDPQDVPRAIELMQHHTKISLHRWEFIRLYADR